MKNKQNKAKLRYDFLCKNSLLNSRRSQVTVFIIIAIIVIFIIGIYFYIRYGNYGNLNPDKNVDNVYSFVSECIKETGEDALYYTGEGGGYLEIPNKSINDEFSYYFYDNKNIMPSKEKIESDLSLYIENFLAFCLNDFSNFKDFDINKGDILVNTKINDNNVSFDVKYPLTVNYGNNNYFFNDFSSVVPIRLGVIYDVSKKIIDKQVIDKEGICISCIYDLANEKNLSIQLMDALNESIVYVISDESYKINDKDYLFYFAGKYQVIK